MKKIILLFILGWALFVGAEILPPTSASISETDPTVEDYIKNITLEDITKWDTAFLYSQRTEYAGINLSLSDTTTLETGVVASVVIPYDCVIQEIILLGDTTGSVSIDIWKDTYANYPPTIDDTILPETHPAISEDIKYKDNTLEGWNTTISAGDILTFYIESVADITKLTIYLKLEKQ